MKEKNDQYDFRCNQNHYLHDNDNVLNSKEISSRFNIQKILGKGAFATVYKASTKLTSRIKERSEIEQYYDTRPRNENDFERCNGTHQINRNEMNRKHYGLVSLKIVNVTKVANRRSETKNNNRDEDLDKKEGQKKGYGDCGGNREIVNSLSVEYDTEALFFPSRIEKKKQFHSKQKNVQNDNNDEYAAIRKLLNREISVHLNVSRQNHPNIVSMLESFQYNVVGNGRTDKDLIVVMVMEYCPFGDLQHYLKQKRNEKQMNMMNEDRFYDDKDSPCIPTLLDMKEIQYAMRHILRGLAFLHSRGIVHRDIKAGNILLSKLPSSNYLPLKGVDEDEKESKGKSFTLFDCCLKIADFGLAAQMSDDDDWDDAQHTFCGTPSCLAPEVVLSTPEPAKGNNISAKTCEKHRSMNEECYTQNTRDGGDVRGHGQPADLWSVGCLFYVMLVGRYPFSRPPKNLNDIQKGEINPQGLPDKVMKMKQTIERVIKGDWSLPGNLSLSGTAVALLSQLLSTDPQKRGFARGLLSTHLFFKEIKDNNPGDHASFSKMNEDHTYNHEVVSDCSSVQQTPFKLENMHNSKLTLKKQVVNIPSACDFQYEKTRAKTEIKPHINFSTIQKQYKDLIQTTSSKRKGSNCSLKSFIQPIKDLHLLPEMKHQWKMKKYRRSGSSEITKLLFTLFILPNRRGLVFQCEKSDGCGAWMHLAGDGENIWLGKLAKAPLQTSFRENNYTRSDSPLMIEAFSRSPRKFKLSQDIPFEKVTSKEHQSMCTMGPSCSTIHSTPSTHSASFPSCNHPVKTKYRKLSCLLQKKNRAFLSLFRKVDKFVKELKRKTPKIHLNIHECDIGKIDCIKPGNLLCTVALLEDSKFSIFVTFVDGFQVKYDRSTGFAEVTLVGSSENSITGTITVYLRRNNITLQNQKFGGTDIESYLSYLQFARSAIKKCVEIEQEIHTLKDKFTHRRTIVAKGKSFRNWVDITPNDDVFEKIQGGKKNTVELVRKRLIDENNVTSVSLLDSNYSKNF